MLHDIDLVPLAADYTVAGQEYAEAANLKSLEEGGSTSRVTMARMMTMRATIVATGTISVFEALLQQSLGWREPFPHLDKHLRDLFVSHVRIYNGALRADSVDSVARSVQIGQTASWSIASNPLGI